MTSKAATTAALIAPSSLGDEALCTACRQLNRLESLLSSLTAHIALERGRNLVKLFSFRDF